METDNDATMAWYAIRTKPHQEEMARRHYLNQHCTVYLPLMRVVRSHARQRRVVFRPVFPGYLFLRLNPDTCDWAAIHSTRGSIGPLRFGEHYVPVPDWIIDGLRAREDEEGKIAPGAFQKEKLAPGCEVEVTMADGSAAKGFFCSFRGKENVEILMDILKRQVRTTVPLDRVRRS
ncbi:MAG: transcriptional activator RfaH [Desulfurivibrio sp.]|nr:transcriptional activator RfaH [Desulfurivibrio sp.]